MPQPHKSAVNKTLLEYASRGWWVWENKTGMAWQRNATGFHPIKFGVPGSPDLIGMRARTITADDIGKTVAQFVGIEVKVGRDRLTDAQQRFGKKIDDMGGIFVEQRIDE